ncbi:MAG: DUF1207 domain-containing protein [Bythopirellula sp.]|nr:DUF1207 domain-containing protein [Bythopirellula sp.]
MNSRILFGLLSAFLALSDVVGSRALAQSVGGRNSNWSPYRPSASADQSIETDSEPIIKPSQYVDCEPCPPEYTDVISDSELTQMRGNRGYYVPAAAQPIYVAPTTGTPFMTTQATNTGWGWEILPADVIWHSYWAGTKESRMAGVVYDDVHNNTPYIDVTLGGRAAIARYGTRVNGQPYGWELQIEGAGQPRLNLDENWDLDAADFRFGVPLIYGDELVQFKFSYYHISSHLGDEFIERTNFPPGDRVNYARDELVLGASFFPLPAWRWYAEAGWAFYADEGAEPWEFQFGVDYAQPGPTGAVGTPFFAVNGHLREEVDFGGAVSAQAGWLWRGNSGKVIRTGLHYYNGKSNQFSFNGPLERFEHQIGGGLWYDY